MEESGPAGMRRDPASVQAEIERTQQRLARTVDGIVDRTAPKNVARRSVERVRGVGEYLTEEARALLVGGGAVRMDSRVIEPSEGSVRLKGDDEVVTSYRSRGQLPPEVLLAGAGVGVAVTTGLVVLWRWRARRR